MAQEEVSRKHFWSIDLIMLLVGTVTVMTSIWMLYKSALGAKQARLVELAGSNTRLIDAAAPMRRAFVRQSGMVMGLDCRPPFVRTSVITESVAFFFVITLGTLLIGQIKTTTQRDETKDDFFSKDWVFKAGSGSHNLNL